MIIHRIKFHHILVYHGDQEIEIPSAGKSSLTVIVGPNNSGKTSFIRGLKFWFYGERGVDNKALPQLLNNKAKADTEVGQSLEAWVEVTFERETARGKEVTCLRRTIQGRRIGEDLWEIQEVSLKEIRERARIEHSAEIERKLQSRLEGMLPKALFDAFYFKGEPLDGKVLGDVGGIRHALGLFLHEEQWKEAESAAAAIRDHFATKLSGLTSKNRELNREVSQEAEIQETLDAQAKALEAEELALADLETQYEEETENLGKLGDEQAARDAKTELNRAADQEGLALRQLRSIEEDTIREIGSSLGAPFLQGAVKPVRKILAGMERDNILPADISEGFIDRVVDRAACICGRPHTGDTRKAWEEYRKKTLAADVNDGLRKLLDWVKPDGQLSILGRSKQITSDLAKLLKDRDEAVRRLNGSKKERTRAQESLASLPHEEISRIGKSLLDLRGRMKTCESRIETFKRAVTATEYSLKQSQAKIKELSGKAGINQDTFKKIQKAKERAEGLHRVLGLCRNRLGNYFHRVLQSAVSKAYDPKATDGSRAHIDKASLLPSIHVRGQKTTNLGGGQSQLLALAYVVALAHLRQNMHAQLERLGVRLGKIDDLSFFMDSPLGNMEEHYKKAAAELMPGSARQVMVLLWKEDWEFARPILEPKADSIYAVKFHTSPENVEKVSPAERVYRFPGSEHELVAALPDGEDQPRSELLKIK